MADLMRERRFQFGLLELGDEGVEEENFPETLEAGDGKRAIHYWVPVTSFQAASE